MSAPIIWIFAPLIFAAIGYFFRSQSKWVDIAGIAIAGILTILAFSLPVGSPIHLRLWSGLPSLLLSETIDLPGASLSIDNSFRPTLALVYLLATIWFACNLAIKPMPHFVPLGLASIATGCAALTIRPAVYAPLLAYFAAILCMPLLTNRENRMGSGLRRFWISQTIGMTILLLTNFLLPFLADQSASERLLYLPIVLLAVGFALVLPVFPFQSWVPQILRESKPFPALFAICSLSLINSILLSSSITVLSITGNYDFFMRGLLFVGSGTILLGGVWAVIENDIGRALGFIFIQQIGAVLLLIRVNTISQTTGEGNAIIWSQYIAFSLGFLLCAISVEILEENHKPSRVDTLKGRLRDFPLASAGLLIGLITLAGFPPLAGFPVLYKVMTETGYQTLLVPFTVLAGFLLLLVFGLRVMSKLKMVADSEFQHDKERPLQLAVLLALIVLIFVLGAFPGIYDIFQAMIKPA